MSRPVALLLLLVSLSLPLQAQFFPDPDYERVLIPVFWFGGGAGGAQWWSNFDITTTGDSFDLATAVLQDNPSCPALCGCDSKKTVQSFRSETVCPAFEHNSGLILYVPRSVDRDEVHAYSRVYDKSQAAYRAGSQIPVVWERDLLAGPMMLLDVKTESRYRSTLRVYDAYQYQTVFTLRFYDMARLRQGIREVVLETTITAKHEGGPFPDNRFPQRPSFAIIGNLVTQYPQLGAYEAVAIEIVGSTLLISPPPPSHRYYAIASITNNATQEVTMVAPR